MWHVILVILKIIGIVLLVILGIILFVVLMVLYVPARYKIEAKKQDEICVRASVTWLLHLISIPVIYEQGKLSVRLKILGFQVKDFMEKPEAASEAAGSDTATERTETFETEETTEPKTDSEAGCEKEKKFSVLRIFSGILEKLKKLKYTIELFCAKIKAAVRKAGSVKEFLLLETTKAALQTGLGQILFLLMKLGPRRIRGWIHFGMDDPAATGQILGVIGAFGGYLPKKLSLIPDFERQILECDLQIRGHLHMSTVVRIAIKLLLDKNVRKAYQKIKSGF